MSKHAASPPAAVAAAIDLDPVTACAGLVAMGYVEVAPVAGARVFQKVLSFGKNHVLLLPDGSLRTNERPTLEWAGPLGERILALLQQKGRAALAAEAAAKATATVQSVSPDEATTAPS